MTSGQLATVTPRDGADDRVRVAYLPQAARRGAEGTLLTGRTSTCTTEALTTDPAPAARNPDDRPGVVGWTATLALREERRIRFGYTVTAARDREVLGMDH